jgi:5'-3' exonuclease
MAKSKLTLIVDGNWLLMSRLAVLNNKYDSADELIKNVKKMLIKSINIALRTFEDIDNIIFVADGGSWRNDIPVPNSIIKKSETGEIISEEYKGTRDQDKSIDWDIIFKGYGDFIGKLNSVGITTCREKNVEGDDWIFFWSNYLNSINTNCIIWSADKDLTQLVHTDKNKCFTIWWNAKNGIKCEDTNDDDLDFFFNNQYDINQEIYNNIVKTGIDIEKINTKHVIIDKILKGDISDNIHPVMIRRAKPDKKTGLITSSKRFKISAKDIDYNLDYNHDNEVLNYLSEIYRLDAYKDRVEDEIDEVFEHYKYNRKLVELSKTEIPEDIMNKMNQYISMLHISKDISKAENIIIAETNDIANIAEFI